MNAAPDSTLCAVCHRGGLRLAPIIIGPAEEQLRCSDCLLFGTNGFGARQKPDKPRAGESLDAWMRRTGRKRPRFVARYTFDDADDV